MQKFDLSDFIERSFEPKDWAWLAVAIEALQPQAIGPWLCGGALRSAILGQQHTTDYDLFFQNEGQLNVWTEIHKNRLNKKFETDNQTTYEYEYADFKGIVQCIKIQYYPNIEAVLDSFDFTICMLGTDGKNLYCGDHTLWDLARKRMVLNKLTYPIATIRRLLKYGNKGFTVCGGCISDILEEVIKRPELVENKFLYID